MHVFFQIKIAHTHTDTTSPPGLLPQPFSNSRERLRRVLRKKSSRYIHLHTLTFADLHLHTFTPADLHLHALTSADLHLHTFTSSHLHTCWSTSSHSHICWSTSSHLHICWSTSSHPHTCWSTSSLSHHAHICRSTSSHLHICRSTSSHLHICKSPLALLSISLLRRERCRLSATKLNPFARNGRWTSKTDVKLRFNLSPRNPSHEMGVERQKLT